MPLMEAALPTHDEPSQSGNGFCNSHQHSFHAGRRGGEIKGAREQHRT